MTIRTTDLYDEDTDTYFDDHTTRCKHGTYIGTPGGPDLMCGPCELGDPDPTINEALAAIAHFTTKLEEVTVWYEGACHDAGIPCVAGDVAMITGTERRELRRWRDILDEASKWSTHPDDNDWLRRRHRASIRSAAS